LSDRDRTSQAVDAPKTGAFTGGYAVNPVNSERVPVWIADYVLGSYGTGAVFACPAHDERDHAFAVAFSLPIREVVAGGDVEKAAYTGDGRHVNSGFLDGLDTARALEKVAGWLEERGVGRRKVNYRLRDWLFSRQRYWGEPFPVLHLEDGTERLLDVDELPVVLPHLEDFRPTSTGAPPLARDPEWLNVVDPKSGQRATRETNTMPQWAGSCWYYLRFMDPHNQRAPWGKDEEAYWGPVDLYVGGAEHAVLHLLYSRFWHKVLYDVGAVSTPEPFHRLVNQGMIHATAYNDSPDMRGKFFYPKDVDKRDDGTFAAKSDGRAVYAKLMKMSKSRYNVTNPDDMCSEYGADAMRLYELFMGPLEDGALWEDTGVAGARRFLDRTWRLFYTDDGALNPKIVDLPVNDRELERALHAAIKKVTEAVESMRFNTAIAEMMTLANHATRAEKLPRDWFEAFVLILSPFAPHLAEELWQALGHHESIAYAAWPAFDPTKLVVDTITVAVQVNGKLRGTVELPAGVDKDSAIAAAKAEPSVARWLDGGELKREVYVPGKLVNLVVAGP
jgi:leucyl-tRNA synthetase